MVDWNEVLVDVEEGWREGLSIASVKASIFRKHGVKLKGEDIQPTFARLSKNM